VLDLGVAHLRCVCPQRGDGRHDLAGVPPLEEPRGLVVHDPFDLAHVAGNVVFCLAFGPLLVRSLGRFRDLSAVLDRERVQEVIIADPDFPQQHAVELVDRCHRRGVTVRIAPSTMEILMHRAEFVPGASVPLFELRPPVFDGFDFALKRSFDVVVSVMLLVVLAPLLLAQKLL
jgi:hypothetical protein